MSDMRDCNDGACHNASAIERLKRENATLREECESLATAIVDAARRAGITEGRMPLTGPEVMLLAQELGVEAQQPPSDSTTVAAAGPGVMPSVSAEPSSHQAMVGGSDPSGYHQHEADTTNALVQAFGLLRRVRDRGDPVQFFEANAVMGMIEAVLPKSMKAPEPPTNDCSDTQEANGTAPASSRDAGTPERGNSSAADAKPSGWRSMESAPKNATWVALLTEDKRGKRTYYIAHFAEGGGEDQPSFGPGWFYGSGGSGYYEVYGEPIAWFPVPKDEPSPARLHGKGA